MLPSRWAMCVVIACGCVWIYMFEPGRQHVRMLFHICMVYLLVWAQRACCWQSLGHLRLEATLQLITCLCSCADTPDHPQIPQHAPEKLQLLEQTQRVPTLKSQFNTHQYPDGDRRVSCRKGNIRAILSWHWLFSMAHGVNGISLKFHRIPAKPICHVRFCCSVAPSLFPFPCAHLWFGKRLVLSLTFELFIQLLMWVTCS